MRAERHLRTQRPWFSRMEEGVQAKECWQCLEAASPGNEFSPTVPERNRAPLIPYFWLHDILFILTTSRIEGNK